MSAKGFKNYHEELIEEEGLNVKELPIEIQKKINGFNHLKAKWEKTQDERDRLLLEKTTVKIGDMIMNYIESDFDDEDEDEDEKPSKNKSKQDEDKDEDEDEKPSKNKSDKKSSDNRPKVRPVSSGRFGNLMMEKKILAVMEARGEKRIRITDLEVIIGKEPDYPEQTVNNIKLRKVFLSSDYRII